MITDVERPVMCDCDKNTEIIDILEKQKSWFNNTQRVVIKLLNIFLASVKRHIKTIACIQHLSPNS